MKPRVGVGEDSHRFLPVDSTKPCILAGVIFDDCPGFNANSDGDVVFHALCNALTSLSGVVIIGGVANDLYLKDGVTDSEVYLREAAQTLQKQTITHVAISIEAKKPRILDRIPEMQESIAKVLGIDASQIGITAISGEGLSGFGLGEGVHALAIVTTIEEDVDEEED